MPNKYLYVWKLWMNYGQGWEDEVWEDTRTEINQRAREYRENCPQYARKIIFSRVPNPEYQEAPCHE
jgi:hypothetical protein